MKYIKFLLVLSGLSALLAGCGGGGGGSTTTTVSYAVSVTVTGLSNLTPAQSIVLNNNGGDAITITADGPYTFATPVVDGGSYNVTVPSKSANLSACLVGNGAGVVNGSNVTTVTVACAPNDSLALVMTVGVKQLQFSWGGMVSTVDHYELYDSTDGTAFTPVNTINPAAVDLTVHQYAWGKKYKVRACLSSTCTAPNYKDSNVVDTTSNMLQAIGYFKASNTGAGDGYGYAVAVSGDGNTMAVGAYNEDSAAVTIDGNQSDNSAANAGAVYVFVRNTTTGAWSQQAYIKAPNAGAGDNFGFAVALSNDGSTLAVGAQGESSSAGGINPATPNTSAPKAGAAYVFARTGTSWSQQAYIKTTLPLAQDFFGSSVALSNTGNTLAVGATGLTSSGSAYVFGRSSGGNWSLQTSSVLKASTPAVADNFGWAVDLSGDGNTLAVGAINANSGSGTRTNSGNVFIFTASGAGGSVPDSGGTWSYRIDVSGSDTITGDQFGHSVALNSDGTTLAVGANLKDDAISGYVSAGAAYVFTGGGGSWTPQSSITVTHLESNDWFGTAVALSTDGNTLVIGSDGEGSSAKGVTPSVTGPTTSSAPASGAVYVYTRTTGGVWSKQSYIKAKNTQGGDYFGSAVAVSGDGKTLAVGAHGEDSGATGIGGLNINYTANDALESGAVYLY